MFGRLGSFAARFRWFTLPIWVIVVAVLTLVAPNIDEVAVSDQRALLPSFKKYFPDRASPSSAVLVFDTTARGRES